MNANGLGKDYIWSKLFQHFNAAFVRKVEEIAHAITRVITVLPFLVFSVFRALKACCQGFGSGFGPVFVVAERHFAWHAV